MSNSQQRIEQLVSKFSADLAALAAEMASETITGVLGGKALKPSATGIKRDPKSIEVLAGQFTAFVKKHPGLRIEQINKQMGSSTKALALPIRKLIAGGVVKTKGEKRSTLYYVK